MTAPATAPREHPQPYATIADAYDRLLDWSSRHWDESPRTRVGDFLDTLWAGREQPVRSIIELCCGTGAVLEELASRGYTVAGLDRSAAMLEQARARLGPGTDLVHAELPHVPAGSGYDAVISVGTGLNYLPTADDLARTLHAMARTVRPGGPVVFDLLSVRMLSVDAVAGFAQRPVVEFDDAAFIWTYEVNAAQGHVDLTYTRFQRRPGTGEELYTRTRELHRMHLHERGLVERLAREAGFTDIAVYDNYSHRPATEATQYEVWTMTAPS
ncbi:class I SAM-dependent DNA methyltransferase [Nocardiopsis sediminis]|uniref:Class I SAM-dependent DNA methyltransferase n=1 Tax=Nocardiopsis sediminis TaxID=1778267 RepID=A0ABV8FQZ5_9ACTN